MQIRIRLALLSIALVMAALPSAHASRRQAAPVKKIAASSSATSKTSATRPVKPAKNLFRRSGGAHETTHQTTHEPAVEQRAARTASTAKSRPSVAHNIGWGAFFATLGTASATQGHVLGTVIGAGATAYNAVKAWLIARRGATVAQAHSIAFNAGWGTFWSGVGVHGLAAGDPLAAAIGIGAGAYNLFKAGRNTRALPGSAE